MLGRHILLVDRRHHQFHPTIARSLIHHEWIVAHAHARMAAIADVVLRAAKAVDQKAAQTFLRTGDVRFGIHRPENVVCRDSGVEASHNRGQLGGSE